MIIDTKSPIGKFVEVLDANGKKLAAFWVDTERRQARAYMLNDEGKVIAIKEDDAQEGAFPRRIVTVEVENVTVRVKPNFPEALRPLLPPELR